MKSLSIIVLASILVFSTAFGDMYGGRGVIGGVRGGGYSSGQNYGQQGYGAASQGYGQGGYQQGGASHGHDRGHESHDFTQITDSHHSSGHDIGGGSSFGSGGQSSGGYSNQEGGQSGFGNQYGSGGYMPYKSKE